MPGERPFAVCVTIEEAMAEQLLDILRRESEWLSGVRRHQTQRLCNQIERQLRETREILEPKE